MEKEHGLPVPSLEPMGLILHWVVSWRASQESGTWWNWKGQAGCSQSPWSSRTLENIFESLEWLWGILYTCVPLLSLSNGLLSGFSATGKRCSSRIVYPPQKKTCHANHRYGEVLWLGDAMENYFTFFSFNLQLYLSLIQCCWQWYLYAIWFNVPGYNNSHEVSGSLQITIWTVFPSLCATHLCQAEVSGISWGSHPVLFPKQHTM